jgi:putative membrane protein
MDSQDDKIKLPTQDRDLLALIRTDLALDRTLLAFMRTALALIGFGFTLAKFMHSLILEGVLKGINPAFPRFIGFALMGLGLIMLLGGVAEYRSSKRKLHPQQTYISVSLMVAIALALLGLSLMINLMTEIGEKI